MEQIISRPWPYETVLVTGGTGTFGVAFLEEFLTRNPTCKIRLLSRDEFKQAGLKSRFKSNPNVSFLIGDVRDVERLRLAFYDVDLVIHAAALKHVPIAEYNPLEVVNTNINGTANVIRACLDAQVSQAIFLSSDKAVFPINLYGATKMVSEKLFVQANNYSSASKPRTRFGVVRYGNVMGSRGSVLDVFAKCLEQDEPLSLTTPDMTRFYLGIERAVHLVRYAADIELLGGILVPHLPSFKIVDLAKAFLVMHKYETFEDLVQYIGVRPGEKIHERLMTEEEVERCVQFQSNSNYCILPAIHDWQFTDVTTRSGVDLSKLDEGLKKELMRYDSGVWPWTLNVDGMMKHILEEK